MAVYLIGKKDIDIDNDIDNVYAIEVNNSREYFNVIGSLNALGEIEFWNDITSLNDYPPVSMYEYFGIPMIENATVDNVENYAFLPRALEVACGIPKHPGDRVKILKHEYGGDTICISSYRRSDLCINGIDKPYHKVIKDNDDYTIAEVNFPIDCFAEDNILTEITNKDKYETVRNGLEDMVKKYFRNLGRKKKRSFNYGHD